MNKNVNASLQVLSSGGTLHLNEIVDRAIEVIVRSGHECRVCPFNAAKSVFETAQ